MDSSTIRNPFQTEIMMEHLTKESFKNKVFDFEANQEWSFAGDKPCIIDFYADWCGHCQQFKPIWNELKEQNMNLNFIEYNDAVLSIFEIRFFTIISFIS